MNESGNLTLITAIVGVVCGVLGAALGIINTWSLFSRNRVKLLVKPTLYDAEPPVRKVRIGVQVINMSAIPITLQDAGVIAEDPSGKRIQFSGHPPVILTTFSPTERAEVRNQMARSGNKLPKRMEPRESFFVVVDHLCDREFIPIRCYAETACLKKFSGKGPALKRFEEVMSSVPPTGRGPQS